MQKLSLRKLSILGLVLMAASAVTAAVLPANSSSTKQANGVYEDSDGVLGGVQSCTDRNGGNVCTVTAGTNTTEVLAPSNTTAGNTE